MLKSRYSTPRTKYLVSKKLQEINLEKEHLNKKLHDTTCFCGYCHDSGSDRIYHGRWEQWWCEKCFNQERSWSDPEKFFNKGEVVNDLDKFMKPCKILSWCPYGALVEDFWSRMEESECTCRVFDHDCPVFYVAEDFNEDSKSLPDIKPKLINSLKECKFYNDTKKRLLQISKPCAVLKWCPYGTLNETYDRNNGTSSLKCKVLPHDCPAFYNAELIMESDSFF